MNELKKPIVLTGFMGVGKSSVARHLAFLLGVRAIDLDYYIEEKEKQRVSKIFESVGEAVFRKMETENLKEILASDAKVISLGGGTWMLEENRLIIKQNECLTVWLQSDFEHCWRNIRGSKRVRPLAQNRAQAQNLFDERAKTYCLAEWHFTIKPEFTSAEVARQIAEQIF